MATVLLDAPPTRIGSAVGDVFDGLGDWALFGMRAVSGVFSRHLKGIELLRVCVEVGVSSVGVVAITGLFSDTAVLYGWWTFVGQWSRLICLVLLVVLLALVRRGLARAAARPPSPSPWS